MNIVAIGAHQDDIEIHCLGTLLRYQQQGGHTFTNVTISNGDKGAQYDTSIPYAEIAKIRIGESTRVAEALGGRYICMGESDEYIRDTDDVRNRLVDILREAKADIVFTHPPVDYNTDHMVTSQIVFHAVMLSNVMTIFTDHEPLAETPATFYMDSTAGFEWQPSHYVDITSVWEKKVELLNLHESQMKNMLKFGGWDLVKFSRIMGQFRGLQSKVEYAEAFKPALAWPRVRAGNFLP
jgi:LmbE family N-acetylglucosaminyl deacetylase